MAPANTIFSFTLTVEGGVCLSGRLSASKTSTLGSTPGLLHVRQRVAEYSENLDVKLSVRTHP